MFYGLSFIDCGVILLFLAGMVAMGLRISRRISSSEGMFIADRSMGKLYQFFLTFGQSTSADGVFFVSREVYRQGGSGIWINMMLLFLTPFHWFTAMWHRRLRLTTVSDFFVLRFRSHFLSMSLAAFLVLSGTMGIGLSYILSYKMTKALMPKEEAAYTLAERESVSRFREMQALEKKLEKGALPAPEKERLLVLREKSKAGELQSYFSHLNKYAFYAVYGGLMVLYAILGGIIAATLADVFQSVLMIVLSLFLMFPIALHRAGGFSGLHEKVPAALFSVFSGNGAGDYTFFMVSGWALTTIVGLLAVGQNVTVSNAAKSEWDARLGMMTGALGKRFMLIPWGLFGLLAIAMYGSDISDPDLLWGILTRDLLGPGFVGLMLVGFTAANIANKCAGSVVCSALFTNNLFRPLFPGLPEAHYLKAGRAVIVFMLLGGMAIALAFDSILSLFKMFISFNIIFGAPMWLSLFWRRVTRAAVIVQVSACFLLIALLPNLVPLAPWLNSRPCLLAETAPDDPAARPAGIYFEKVVRLDPDDPASPRTGTGEFFPQILILDALGADFSRSTKAEIEGARFYFNCLLPFLILILVSLFTRQTDAGTLNAFYARKNTPVEPDPARDARELAASVADPDRFRHLKLFPRSNWEMLRPTRVDILGFLAGWAIVGAIILLLWGVMRIQWP